MFNLNKLEKLLEKTIDKYLRKQVISKLGNDELRSKYYLRMEKYPVIVTIIRSKLTRCQLNLTIDVQAAKVPKVVEYTRKPKE